MTAHRCRRRTSVLAAALVLLAACGSSSGAAVTTAEVAGEAGNSPGTASVEAASTTTVPVATTSTTIAVTTTAPPSTTTTVTPSSTAPRTTLARTTVPRTTVPTTAPTTVALPVGECGFDGQVIRVDLSTAKNGDLLAQDPSGLNMSFGTSVTGDIDGDGAPDALVAVICNSGGSGSIWQVEAISNNGASIGRVPYGSQSTERTGFASGGDRENIELMRIANRTVFIGYEAHTDADPMCCPSLRVVDAFVRTKGVFHLADRQVATPPPGSS